MKKLTSLFYVLVMSSSVYSQMGINTNTPKATFDITGKPSVTTETDGLIAPRLTGDQLKAKDALYGTDQTGAIVYVTAVATPPLTTKTARVTSAGYYYFSGSAWALLALNTVGDIKTGIQPGDHDGWIKLDGRATSLLTATQQVQATLLGIGANLPDATNAYLVQNGATPGSVSGSNTTTLSQTNLPAVSFTGNTGLSGAHSHSFSPNVTSLVGQGLIAPSWTLGTGGTPINFFPMSYFSGTTGSEHSHNVTVSSGGSGTPVNIQPRSLSVNTFIYLGD